MPIVPANAVIAEEIFRVEKEKYFFGDLIVYSCKAGYKNAGSSYVATCTQQGTWSMDLNCKKTSEIWNDPSFFSFILFMYLFSESNCTANMPKLDWPHMRVDASPFAIFYHCEKDYEIFYGSLIRFCDESTYEWTGIDPVCESENYLI